MKQSEANLVGFSAYLPSLAVTKDCPRHARIDQLRHRYLSGVGAIWLVEDVLGGNLNLVFYECSYKAQIDGRRGNNDLFGPLVPFPLP